MAQIQGGPAIPVSVVTGGKIKGGKAIPVYGYTSAPTDGRRAAAGPARPVYVVSDAQMAAGMFQLEGGPAMPMYVAPSGLSVVGDAAQPVYVVGGSLGGSTTPTVTPLIADNFTDTNGTAITAHTIAPTNTPATAWSNLTNGFTIQSNRAQPNTEGAFNVSTANAGVADGIVAATIDAGSLTDHAGITFRATDGNNYWAFWLKDKFRLWKVEAGGFTEMAALSSFEWVLGTEVAVILSGTSIIAYVNAFQVLSITNSFNQSATKHGVSAVRTSHQLDNFFVGTAAGMPSGALKNYVFCGDSLTSGTLGAKQMPYPMQTLKSLFTTPIRSARGNNLGVGGQTAALIETAQGASANALFSASYLKNICVVWVGSNDVAASTAATTIHGYISSFCSARRSAGFKVAVCNIIKRGDYTGGHETIRTTLNGLIAAGYTSYADAYVDLAANAAFSNPADTTYYAGDTVHLNTAGDTVVAGLVATAISGL